jgi:hypothetical protein
MAIDWSKAPEGAEFYAYGGFRKPAKWSDIPSVWTGESWTHGGYTYEECEERNDYEPRPQQWPETDERINNIGLNRTTEDMGHYDEQREQHEQAQPAAPQANKYDRTILGKYGSGKCTVDVYRVLNAFPSGSPEIDHALKKLLAPGKRGVKGELQDLKEAIQSIEARIDYLKELGE